MDEIREIVQKFGDQIEIMAGSGICTENLQEILAETSVTAVHFSASSNHCKVTEFGALQKTSLEYRLVHEKKLNSLML